MPRSRPSEPFDFFLLHHTSLMAFFHKCNHCTITFPRSSAPKTDLPLGAERRLSLSSLSLFLSLSFSLALLSPLSSLLSPLSSLQKPTCRSALSDAWITAICSGVGAARSRRSVAQRSSDKRRSDSRRSNSRCSNSRRSNRRRPSSRRSTDTLETPRQHTLDTSGA
jgi:hypothetical protein